MPELSYRYSACMVGHKAKPVQELITRTSTMFATVILGISTLGLAAAIYVWIKGRKVRNLIEQIPGPKALPFFGNVLGFKKDNEEFYLQLEEFCKTYKGSGVMRLWFGPRPVALTFRADIMEALFNSSKNIKKTFTYKFLESWIQKGLLTSDGEKWHRRRKLLTPSFHFKILEEFLHVFNEQSQVLLDILDDKVGDEAFDVQQYLARCTLDVICETAMGVSVNAQKETESQYVKAVYSISSLIFDRVKRPWLYVDFLWKIHPLGKKYNDCLKILHGFTRKVIRERKAAFDEQWKMENANKADDSDETKPMKLTGKRLAFLDMLLAASKKDPSFTEDDIQEEVDTFMFEGHDTTAAAAVWTLYVIGTHREIQKKLQEEVDSVFGDDDRPATMDDVSRLKYLECVIKETMRLYPVVPIFGRELTEDCKMGDYDVPKGTTIFVMVAPLHRDPKVFSNADTLIPERWLSENSGAMHPFSYIPFSAGLRNCIGQKFAMIEEKVLLSSLLRRFTITCTDPADDIARSGLLILRPSKGIHITVARRVK